LCMKQILFNKLVSLFCFASIISLSQAQTAPGIEQQNSFGGLRTNKKASYKEAVFLKGG
jgi:hypothetical protein